MYNNISGSQREVHDCNTYKMGIKYTVVLDGTTR